MKIFDRRAFSPFETVPGSLIKSVEIKSSVYVAVSLSHDKKLRNAAAQRLNFDMQKVSRQTN